MKIVKRGNEGLKQWKIDMERNQAKHENNIEIARKLKAEGMDEKLIKKMTSLYMHEIRKL